MPPSSYVVRAPIGAARAAAASLLLFLSTALLSTAVAVFTAPIASLQFTDRSSARGLAMIAFLFGIVFARATCRLRLRFAQRFLFVFIVGLAAGANRCPTSFRIDELALRVVETSSRLAVAFTLIPSCPLRLWCLFATCHS